MNNVVIITSEVSDALLTAAEAVDDIIGLLDLSKVPYAGESLGDIRDLLLMIAKGDLSTLSG